MKNKLMILAMIAVVGLSTVGCSTSGALPDNTPGNASENPSTELTLATELTSDEIQSLQAVTQLVGLK